MALIELSRYYQELRLYSELRMCIILINRNHGPLNKAVRSQEVLIELWHELGYFYLADSSSQF